MDYESPLARGVAGGIWSGLYGVTLDAGYTKTTALWESLRASKSSETLEGPQVHIFAVDQDRPDAIDVLHAVGDAECSHIYGVVVAVPDRPSPLAGSLLYQGVERLTGRGVKVGAVEPALMHALPKECESYVKRILERLSLLLGE